MTMNIMAASSSVIICASDRRLTGFASGTIQTNRSTKIISFACANAHGAITYNGIGLDDDGLTPCDWIRKLEEDQRLFSNGIDLVLEGVKADVERRVREFHPLHSRHSFLLGVWFRGIGLLYCVSNYEYFDDGKLRSSREASQNFTIGVLPPCLGNEVRVVSGGHPLKNDDRRNIMASLAEGHTKRTRALCFKATKRIAIGKQATRGAVGASVQWAMMGEQANEVWIGHDVAGGSRAHEPPDLVNAHASMSFAPAASVRSGFYMRRSEDGKIMIKDAFVTSDLDTPFRHFDPHKGTFIGEEFQCGVCKTPLPSVHKVCEVCLYEGSKNIT